MERKQFVRGLASGFLPGLVTVAWCAGAVAQHTERVSVSSSGGEGDYISADFTALSGDGRFVVFSSYSTNLVTGDTNGLIDEFLHDRRTGVTERVSVSSSGAEAFGFSGGKVDITPDGRFVAFSDSAANLVSGDTNSRYDVFVRDRLNGTTERVSVSTAGVEGNYDSFAPSISDDGRYVAFESYASNLVSNDTNSAYDIFVRDRANGTTTRVSLTYLNAQANGFSEWPEISADGTLVAYYSDAPDLVPNDNNGARDIFLSDWVHGTIQQVSVDSSGVGGDGDSHYPLMSGDGRFIVFTGQSDNLVAGDTNKAQDIFLRDVVNGTTERISVDSSGAQANSSSNIAGVSDDGRFVYFTSAASNLVANDTNGTSDVFRRDRSAGTTVRVSMSSTGVQSDGPAIYLSVSRDGRFVAFDDSADNLVPNDTNGYSDIFVNGPWLTLEADPPVCAAGTLLTFDTFTGSPGGQALLVCTDVNGGATFIPVLFGAFDGAGVWSYSATVPTGFVGVALTFETIGIDPNGKAAASNPTVVTFQ